MARQLSLSRRHWIVRAVLASVSGAGVALISCLAMGQDVQSTVHDDIVVALDRAPLRMQLRGMNADDGSAWQTEFRAQLNRLLGDSTPPKDWRVTEEGRTDCSDHFRYELVLRAESVPSVPLYLLVPKGLAEGQKAPAVVCLHGHGTHGHDLVVGRKDIDGIDQLIKEYHADYGLQFVRRGYVVVAPCMIPFGRRVDESEYGGQDPCAVAFVRMLALGQLLITSNLRDVRWSIDFLQSRSEVDPERIGCAGLSYGGRMTMLTAAIDDRVRVAAVSGALNLLQERLSARYSCGSQIIPGLLEYGDFSEIGSLIAPRPCVWEVGATDPLIVPKWDDLFRSRLREAYQALGAADQLVFDKFEGPHVWNGRAAFPLFDRVLKQATNKTAQPSN